MNADRISTRSSKCLDVALGLDDHQVDVDVYLGRLPHRVHDHRTERDVGYEATIHHVDVDPVGAREFRFLYLFGQPSEVRAQDRRGNPELSSGVACGFALERFTRWKRHGRKCYPSTIDRASENGDLEFPGRIERDRVLR